MEKFDPFSRSESLAQVCGPVLYRRPTDSRYLALLLWGGAYAEDDQVLKVKFFMSGAENQSIHLGSIARTASNALSPILSSIRTDLQPLAPPPPPLPDFIPLSLDPSRSDAEEPVALEDISLVLHRRPGATWVDRFPLSSDLIMVSVPAEWTNCRKLIHQVKAFHPVFLDIVERMSSQIHEEMAGHDPNIDVSDSSLGDLDRKLISQTRFDDIRLLYVPPYLLAHQLMT